MIRLTSLSLCLLLTVCAWSADERVDYLRDVKPILRRHCFACHAALKQEGGLRLDTMASMRQGGDSGSSLQPGKAAASLLIERIQSADESVRMPQEGMPLNRREIETLAAWVREGAKGPADEEPEPDPAQHWAFIPPVRPPIPDMKGDEGPGNPLDAFIIAEHDRHGLFALPEAEKHILLRRVYLDLVGLPPTRRELHAFLDDAGDDAYERVVDRLLASPRYGERWGRHWMDVWRYSDWYGRRRVNDVRNSYPHVWRWRDWIVRSLNEDKGYDRMVVEMLAADEVDPENDDNIVALGFIVRNWFSLNYDQWMKDLVEHTGKAFLGVRLNCAHCHDHKYDPITQEEYFKFRAFFEPLELRHDQAPGGPPLTKYLRYVPSSGGSLKPIAAGIARIYDHDLDAKTYMYKLGDARNRFDRPSVQPGAPAILGGKPIAIERQDLPPTAWYPGLKPFVQREATARHQAAVVKARKEWGAAKRRRDEKLAGLEKELRERESQLKAAQDRDNADEVPNNPVEVRDNPDEVAGDAALKAAKQSREIAAAKLAALRLSVSAAQEKLLSAEAGLVSIQARIAADNARFLDAGSDVDRLIQTAAMSERTAAKAAAKARLAAAESSLAAAQGNPLDAKDRSKGIAAAKKELGAAKTALAKAETALAKMEKTPNKAGDSYTPLSPTYPRQTSGRRAALARWIANSDNPLTARVAVNHIWMRHIGRPLVESVVDFGRAGRPPTHPKLLDWLAVELTESGWSMKHLHRLIVTSGAYRRQSKPPAADHVNLARDPDNRYLWRFDRRRAEAEVIRDAMLHLAGALDHAIGGQEIEPNQEAISGRRSLYFAVYPEAGGMMPFVSTFDGPAPSACYQRTESVVPQQALAMTNSRVMLNASRSAARDLWAEVGGDGTHDDGADNSGANRRSAYIAAAFELVLSRQPSPHEFYECEAFMQRQEAIYRDRDAKSLAGQTPRGVVAPSTQPEARAAESLMRVLFNHNEFVTIP